jgi:hypothetical protein
LYHPGSPPPTGWKSKSPLLFTLEGLNPPGTLERAFGDDV